MQHKPKGLLTKSICLNQFSDRILRLFLKVSTLWKPSGRFPHKIFVRGFLVIMTYQEETHNSLSLRNALRNSTVMTRKPLGKTIMCRKCLLFASIQQQQAVV